LIKSILYVLVAFFTTFSSFACDCLVYPVESYINKVDYIFTGKVIELLEEIDSTQYIMTKSNRKFYQNKSYSVRLVTIELLKTGGHELDTLEFISDYSNCDPLYELGKTYLLFVNRTSDDKFITAHCTPWGEIAKSVENIKRLKNELIK